MQTGQFEEAVNAFDTEIGLSNDPTERLDLAQQKPKRLSV